MSAFSDSRSTANQPTRRAFLGGGLLGALTFGLARPAANAQLATTPSGNPFAVTQALPTLTPEAARDAHRAMAARWRSIQQTATPEQLYRLLYALPKGGDLHHHLGGGMLPQMWYDIATDAAKTGGQRFYTRTKISSPALLDLVPHPDSRAVLFWTTISEQAYAQLDRAARADFKPLDALSDDEAAQWKSSVVLDRAGEGRDEFFEYIWFRLNHLLGNAHVLGHCVVENMRRFGAEGTRYLELMGGDGGLTMPDDSRLTPDEAADWWRERLSQPDAKATGVEVRFKAIVLRFADDAEANVERAFAHIDTHRDLFVGLDMAGREDDNRGYAARFRDVYDRMWRRYDGSIGFSMHAGEAEKRDTQIFDTLRLGATRIGHAINLQHDDRTMQMLRGGPHLLEINPVSNHLLGYVPEPANHPFPIYLRQGIPCCLNTDDRGMWSSNHTDEFMLGHQIAHLTWDELVTLTTNSLTHAFLEPDTKARLLAAHETALAAYAAHFSGDDWAAKAAAIPAVNYGYANRAWGLALG